jgi:RND family efflux transporter MFP subunit
MSDQLSSDLAALKIDRGDNPERRKPLKVVLGLLLLGAAGALAYVLGLPYLENRVFKKEVQVTEILLLSPAQETIELTATGYVMPQVTANVAPKVPGKVARVLVKQGVSIQQGDVLFELDVSEQNAAIATAQSRVASARAAVETAKANVLEAEQQAQRATLLSKQGVGPQSAADDLTARASSLRAAVKAAEAQAVAAQREVEALRVNSDNYVVRAPISGTIINKPPEVGELVGPAMAGVVSQLGGVEIADFTSLQVESDVPEQRLGLVAVGRPCEITLDAFADKRFRGKVSEITPRVNRAKATVVVKVGFVDPPERVLPDMAARVSFLAKELDARAMQEKPKLVVPSSAIVTRSSAKHVFVIEGDRVRLTPVKLGPPMANGFVLLSGAGPGARVVSEPPDDLVDGQAIKQKGEG